MTAPLVKICGLSTPDTVEAAIRLGASHIGLNLFPTSPRYVDLKLARALRDQAHGRIIVVLLLVNSTPPDTVAALAAVQPDIVQFHGMETPEWLAAVKAHSPVEVWKAVGLKDADTLTRSARFVGSADRLLFDSPAQALPGGTGTRFDWSLLKGHRHALPWGLAGGLTPDNVAEAITVTGAPLVDVSSGVESAPGVKDVDKMAAFIKAVRTLP
ncbi:MAG: phosphoribosylanthranilate isomerase [Sphingopyxis sp.]|nr:phosphoribosylanthranilate isomerase [Sphingopyxis sp.]